MVDGLTLDVAARAVAAALLHSVWQGAVAAGFAAIALRARRAATTQARYVHACRTLAGLVGAWTTTAVRSAIDQRDSPVTPAPGTSRSGPPLLRPGPLDFSPA